MILKKASVSHGGLHVMLYAVCCKSTNTMILTLFEGSEELPVLGVFTFGKQTT